MLRQKGIHTLTKLCDFFPVYRFGECLPTGEVPVKRADADPCATSDALERDRPTGLPAVREFGPSRIEQPLTIAYGVSARPSFDITGHIRRNLRLC